MLLVVGYGQVLYSSGFLCVSSHYLIPSSISSLVVKGLGVIAPTPKAQGLISHFAGVYIFFSAGQVLLSTLSWCSACTFVSEGVFLMYPRREVYSTSPYSSAILFFPYVLLLKNLNLGPVLLCVLLFQPTYF